MLFQNERDALKTLAEVKVLYNSLPASTGFTISYSVNGAAYVAFTDFDDVIQNAIVAQLRVESIGSLQLKVAFDVSSNSAPIMEALALEME